MDLRAGNGRQNVLSLCAGYGGLDLGVKLAVPSARTVCYVEIEAFSVAVLVEAMHSGILDDAPVWTDLKTFGGEEWRGRVDGIIGGYPCPPFSCAGQRRGVEDERHLWPHIQGIVAAVRPVWCFFENVSGHVSLGFGEVVRSLQDMDYVVEAGLFTASEVGASHKRERLFILAVADTGSDGRADGPQVGADGPQVGAEEAGVAGQPRAGDEPGGECGSVADTSVGQLAGRRQEGRAGAGPGGAELAHSSGERRQQDPGSAPGDEEANGGAGRNECQQDGDHEPSSDCPELAHGPCGRCGELRQPGAGQPDGGDGELDDSTGSRCDRCGERTEQGETAGSREQAGVQGSDERCVPVAHSECAGLEGQDHRPHGTGRQEQTGPTGPSGRELPLFAPGPSDPAWPTIIAERPDLAPAIEEEVKRDLRRLAHGPSAGPSRVDMLRAGGNGVVPICAGYAFATLAQRLGIAVNDDGQVEDMTCAGH